MTHPNESPPLRPARCLIGLHLGVVSIRPFHMYNEPPPSLRLHLSYSVVAAYRSLSSSRFSCRNSDDGERLLARVCCSFACRVEMDMANRKALRATQSYLYCIYFHISTHHSSAETFTLIYICVLPYHIPVPYMLKLHMIHSNSVLYYSIIHT